MGILQVLGIVAGAVLFNKTGIKTNSYKEHEEKQAYFNEKRAQERAKEQAIKEQERLAIEREKHRQWDKEYRERQKKYNR